MEEAQRLPPALAGLEHDVPMADLGARHIGSQATGL
jgi:hypothetical protein